MDGMLHFQDGSAVNKQGSPLGILYAEDFDDVPAPPAASPPAAEPAVPAPTAADLERACTIAVENARAAWDSDRSRQRVDLLNAVAAALTGARSAAEQVALAAAEATIATVLGLLAGALPSFCREHGPTEARAVLNHLLPLLRTEPRVTIRVHPALVPLIQEDVAALQSELAGSITVLPAALEPGDLKVSWDNGSFKRDTAQILQAMQDALAQLGLLQPLDLSPERSMAHAE